MKHQADPCSLISLHKQSLTYRSPGEGLRGNSSRSVFRNGVWTVRAQWCGGRDPADKERASTSESTCAPTRGQQMHSMCWDQAVRT